MVPKIAGSILPCARIFTFFSAVYHGKIPEVLKNRRSIAGIYPALIREIFSRRGPLSSGVIMCMYGNFTLRLVTVQYSSPISHLFAGEEVLGLCCGLTGDVLDEAVTLALPRHLGDHQEAGRHATITYNFIKVLKQYR